jgi:TonB-linked SusC/RagA family outer membrane protein
MRKLLLLLMAGILSMSEVLAQSRTITGKVTDETGAPVPNASVLIKGSNTGTTTNMEGNFQLTVPASTRILVISSIGFETKEVAIGNSNHIVASLTASTSGLQEVVITSFGIKRDKKTLGYSTPVINAEELTAVRNSNITNSLVAKVSGLRVQGSGGSFTGSSVLIRGYTSMTGGSAPLYVVDGIPIDNSGGGTALQTGTTTSNRAVDINPDDIESMTVLKGAAATSLYGSRGAGGVILITTKKGRKGTRNTIDITSSYNIVQANRFPKFQNQYAQGASVAGPGGTRVASHILNSASSWGPEIKGQPYTDFYGRETTLQAYPNNFKDMFQTGYGAQNSVSFSGGSERTVYRVSYGNTQETYILRNNKLNRNNLTVNLTSDVTSKLSIGTFINFNNTTSRRTQQGNQLSNPVFRALFIPRSYDLTGSPYYDSDGNQWFYGGEDNPYWSIDNVRYRDETNRLFGNINVKYKFTSWLDVDLKVGSDFYSFSAPGFDEIGIRGGGNTNSQGAGGVVERRNTVRNLNSYLTVNANHRFGDFMVSGTLGNEIFDNYSTTSTVTGLTLNVKGFDQMSNATSFSPSYGTSRTRTVGVFADAVIEYKSWLSLNLKARNDFPSTLPLANNSVFYPAAALSVVLTEAIEGLKSDFVNAIKLRGNWGKVGRGPGPYNTDNYAVSAAPADGFGPSINYPFNGLLGYTISNSAGNPTLKPEFTTEWEIGTDINLWDNRIILEANYYQRKLTEGLFSVPYSAASGITSVFQNAGEIDTKGLELALTVVPVRTKKFTWSVNGNFTKFKSIVTKLAPGVSVITLAGFTTPNVRLMEGEEYGVIYGNMYQRHANGQLLLGPNGLPLPTNSVFKIGNPNPKFTLGITNTFTYGDFTLDVLLDIRNGGDLYSRNLADLRRNGVAIETAEKPRLDKDGVTYLTNYQFEGVDVNGNPVNVPITAEQYWGNSGKYVAAEGYIVNTSWVRVREANLFYKMPRSLTEKTPFSNIELGVFGRNLFLWTKDYPHLDPEQNVLGLSNIQGLEFNANLSTRTMGLSLRLTL